jgi:hypothetical protein
MINLEFPPSFIHESPEGYSYSFESFNAKYDAIWILNHGQFSYRDTPPKSIWGFYSSKKGKYYAPINSKKVGKEVSIENTTPYTSMQKNYNPLEAVLFS